MRTALLILAACSSRTVATHSSSIAVDGDRIYVVNPDADSVSILEDRKLVAEIALGHPAGDFTPSVMPRALAVSGGTLYVTGERAGALFAIDLATQAVRTLPLCSEPIGVLASPDGRAVYVACSQDDAVVRVDTATLTVTRRTPVAREPWALAWSPRGQLLVSHLLTPTITALDPDATWTIPAIALRDNDRRLPHGTPRGFYDLAARPGTEELWVAHLLLGTDTPQPALDFESTVFPAISLIHADGTYRRTLSVDVEAIARTDGSIADVVSGPHAIAFTADGDYALIVDENSEDVLAIDARTEVEAGLLRPLPGHMPEGIVVDGDYAYIDERNSGDVAIVRISRGDGLAMTVEGTIPRLARDPMPRELRIGQHLFYSANSDEVPITRNHWVACASCHLEGRSDAVTWQFTQGLRDTPSNAGGTDGFLFRTADRTKVEDYWQTIDVEQGGRFDPTAQAALLAPLAAYVQRGIPAPIPPTTDPLLAARGKQVFAQAGCASCHAGPRFTDSGAGNAALDLAGAVVLHDVGTCGGEDVAHPDRDGHPRAACAFDTPTLVGAASSPPFLHDGSAPTLAAAVARHAPVEPADEVALVEYLRSL